MVVCLPDVVGRCHSRAGDTLLVGPRSMLRLNVAHALLLDHGLHDLFPPAHMALNFSCVFGGSRVCNLWSLTRLNVAHALLLDHGLHDLFPPAHMALNFSC